MNKNRDNTKLKDISLKSSVKDVLATNISDLVKGKVKTVIDNTKSLKRKPANSQIGAINKKSNLGFEQDTIFMSYNSDEKEEDYGMTKPELISLRDNLSKINFSKEQGIELIYVEVTQYLSLDQSKLFKKQLEKMNMEEIGLLYSLFKTFKFVDLKKATQLLEISARYKSNIFLLIITMFNSLDLKNRTN